ncbi:unnamed protein product [Rotaria sp. Silwood1]|nr:unnamed protein product [Rotaria sp. Silwood1]CAF5091126.1 unnamed protein product [Rotaria sp. Silwood1]
MSTGNFGINKTLSTDGKYHLILVYRADDYGEGIYYGGGYYEPSMEMTGAVGGKSIKEIIDEAYESLEEAMKSEKNIPYDINNIRNLIKFDLVECYNEKEMEKALECQEQQMSCEEIDKIILK